MTDVGRDQEEDPGDPARGRGHSHGVAAAQHAVSSEQDADDAAVPRVPWLQQTYSVFRRHHVCPDEREEGEVGLSGVPEAGGLQRARDRRVLCGGSGEQHYEGLRRGELTTHS